MGERVKVKVFVKGRLATTFWAETDEDVYAKVHALKKQFIKRNVRETAVAKFHRNDATRISEIHFDYAKPALMRLGSTAIKNIARDFTRETVGEKRSGVAGKYKGAVCPIARPEA